LRFFFFSDNIKADVASKQQTTTLFLSTIFTRTRRHTELIKKTDKPDGKPVLCQRTFSSVFRGVFFYTWRNERQYLYCGHLSLPPLTQVTRSMAALPLRYLDLRGRRGEQT
jgi:hypothetical protein